jgi:hypothetical protein
MSELTGPEWGFIIIGVLFLIGMAFSDEGPGLAVGFGKRDSKKEKKDDNH